MCLINHCLYDFICLIYVYIIYVVWFYVYYSSPLPVVDDIWRL